MRIKTRAFTVVELLVIVAAVLILAALALPSLSRSHKSVRIECVNNLKQVGLAFRLWSGDCGDKYPMQALADESKWSFHLNATNGFRYFQVMSNELATPKNLVCPADKKRKPAANFTNGLDNSHISYFAGLDADETMPLTFLAGDWNITNGQSKTNNILCLQTNQLVGWIKDLHKFAGNIAMADGSVRQLNNSGLQKSLGDTGLATNRLLFP
jgi:prepilin-type processing-associated H-X9-DG protein